jgi:hypothetical protein
VVEGSWLCDPGPPGVVAGGGLVVTTPSGALTRTCQFIGEHVPLRSMAAGGGVQVQPVVIVVGADLALVRDGGAQRPERVVCAVRPGGDPRDREGGPVGQLAARDDARERVVAGAVRIGVEDPDEPAGCPRRRACLQVMQFGAEGPLLTAGPWTGHVTATALEDRVYADMDWYVFYVSGPAPGSRPAGGGGGGGMLGWPA